MPRGLDGSTLLGGGSRTHFNAVALPAISPPLRSDTGILFRPLMPVRTVRSIFTSFNPTPAGGGRIVREKPTRSARLLNRQATANPIEDGFWLPASGSSDISQVNGSLIGFHINRIAPVTRLFASTGPFAVIRRVGAIIVNSLYRVPLWPLPHILSKISERIKPPFANQNTPTPISVVLLESGIIAPALHTHPNGIKGMRVLKWHKPSGFTRGVPTPMCSAAQAE